MSDRDWQVLAKADKIVSPEGCSVFVVGDGGEVLGSFPVSGGIVLASRFWDLLEPGLHLETDGVVFRARRSAVISEAPGRLETAANPDWQPQMMTDFERQARAVIRRMQEQNDIAEARAFAWQREAEGRRVPQAPEAEVVEPLEPPAADA